MPDQPINPANGTTNQVELARLALETERLKLENERLVIEKPRVYLEQWDSSTRPMHEHAVEMARAAIGFAQGALRTAFLLNGGALIALPTFSAIFRAGTKSIAALLGASIGCFVAGLVACVLAHLFTFFTTSAAAQNRDAKVELQKININLQHKRVTPEAAEAAHKAQEAIRAKQDHNTKRWEKAAFISLFGSIVLFSIGAVLGAIKLMQ
ncbi:MAG TPA: hypothetical protein VNF99_09550 [Stellaceae bacterium]|nr:hypothetical protein [Stellaceae bacterium]